MLFTEVIKTSAAVGATRSRKAKITALSQTLSALDPAEIEPVVGWLSGEPRQGRIGAGWRTLSSAAAQPAALPSLTVAEVDGLLSDLAATAGPGAVARRGELLHRLLSAATAAEQDFLVRLVGGELRHGALEGVMTDAVAAAAGLPPEAVRRAFMLSGRLPVTAAAALTGGADALSAFRLEVGRPIRPMLAAPGGTPADSVAELGAVQVEYKLDGARIQVHRAGSAVWVYTRTLRDITANVPELVALVRGLECHSVVLDGETLALDDAGRPRSFQESMSRFGSVLDGGRGPAPSAHPRADAALGSEARAAVNRELLLHPFFFDCLHLNGVDLLDEPLERRLTALSEVAGPHRVPALVRPSAEQAAAHLDAALAAGHEGVVVKALDSPYAAGRRGRSWQKIKPEHTLDLVVLGAEWGYGRRTGTLSNLHLGARDPDGGPPVMVGKTFKGLTDKLLHWQTAEFPNYESHRDEHTVYLRPELVVEIELDGAQRSTRYPGGVALRFARVLRYRPDKTPAEADTIDAVRALLPPGP
ncbi:MAG: ATP-dependent DNA ligase [Mycobacteriaceae bacterium]|nr:ATP-dependent DNA ligase [Mycobacteriaceae bacterium]